MSKEEFNKKLAKIMIAFACLPFDMQLKFIGELLIKEKEK